MAGLNRFTAFMGNAFTPVFSKIVYKNMRSKPIVAKQLKKLSSLTDKNINDIKLIAHRGLSGDNPENTAPSFTAAGKLGGYFGLECDTHMTKDGVWMVLHDPTIETIYSGVGDIKSLTYDELMKFDVVRGANIEKYPLLKMCTLQEYIDICKKYNCVPVIEIKDVRSELMPSFYEILVKNDIVDSVVIISFILDNLKALSKIDPKLNMWYLVDYITSKSINDAKQAGCTGIDFSSAFNACRPEWIKKIHNNGLVAACWTVDDQELFEKMLDAGVKYITTNTILPE